MILKKIKNCNWIVVKVIEILVTVLILMKANNKTKFKKIRFNLKLRKKLKLIQIMIQMEFFNNQIFNKNNNHNKIMMFKMIPINLITIKKIIKIKIKKLITLQTKLINFM